MEKRIKPQVKPSLAAWRVDETCIKGKGQWLYPSRAVDSDGKTVAFGLSAQRDAAAAQACFEKARATLPTVTPRVIHVEQNAASPKAVEPLKAHAP